MNVGQFGEILDGSISPLRAFRLSGGKYDFPSASTKYRCSGVKTETPRSCLAQSDDMYKVIPDCSMKLTSSNQSYLALEVKQMV